MHVANRISSYISIVMILIIVLKAAHAQSSFNKGNLDLGYAWAIKGYDFNGVSTKYTWEIIHFDRLITSPSTKHYYSPFLKTRHDELYLKLKLSIYVIGGKLDKISVSVGIKASLDVEMMLGNIMFCFLDTDGKMNAKKFAHEVPFINSLFRDELSTEGFDLATGNWMLKNRKQLYPNGTLRIHGRFDLSQNGVTENIYSDCHTGIIFPALSWFYDRLDNYTLSDDFSDCVIVLMTNGKEYARYPAHRVIVVGPNRPRLIPKRERHTKWRTQVDTYYLENENVEALNASMNFMYTGKLGNIEGMLFDVWYIAFWMGINHLLQYCESIACNQLHVNNAHKYFDKAREFKARRLSMRIMAFIAAHRKAIESNPEFNAWKEKNEPEPENESEPENEVEDEAQLKYEPEREYEPKQKTLSKPKTVQKTKKKLTKKAHKKKTRKKTGR